MHWLNVSYSIWFNRKYNRVGPLLHGRSKAILHETTEALMINRYIHLNPARIAALGDRLDQVGAIGRSWKYASGARQPKETLDDIYQTWEQITDRHGRES